MLAVIVIALIAVIMVVLFLYSVGRTIDIHIPSNYTKVRHGELWARKFLSGFSMTDHIYLDGIDFFKMNDKEAFFFQSNLSIPNLHGRIFIFVVRGSYHTAPGLICSCYPVVKKATEFYAANVTMRQDNEYKELFRLGYGKRVQFFSKPLWVERNNAGYILIFHGEVRKDVVSDLSKYFGL